MTRQDQRDFFPSFWGKGLSKSSVVNLNISAEPSQSAHVIIGVLTYTYPLDWKYSWIANAATLLILKIALNVLVLGLKWATLLKNSLVCLFGWIG